MSAHIGHRVAVGLILDGGSHYRDVMTAETTTPRLTWPVVVAIAVTVLAWASAFVVIRGAGQHFSGGAIALGRLAVAAPLLTIVVVVGRRWVRPTAREWMQLIGFGALWFGI
jgi:drug/metabolite transporter (DMT)-like permease